jgi:hypothetical protein
MLLYLESNYSPPHNLIQLRFIGRKKTAIQDCPDRHLSGHQTSATFLSFIDPFGTFEYVLSLLVALGMSLHSSSIHQRYPNTYLSILFPGKSLNFQFVFSASHIAYLK